jgi:hypothetical protein
MRVVPAAFAIGVASVVLMGCGSPVDRHGVERAQLAITAQCGGKGPTDVGILKRAVATLERNYRASPTRRFRFVGGQAYTTMRDEVHTATDALLICEPQLASALARATGQPLQ